MRTETTLPRLAGLILALLMLLPVTASAQKGEDGEPAQSQVVVAAQSVVRVALIANDPKQGEYLLGHGSGVAVAPRMIVTNAHVVGPLRESPNIAISIVPSSGSRRYPGELVASDTRADLALIRMQGGEITPLTIFTGSPDETARVAAIGYPGSVDLAENLSATDRVSPIPAVRTFGQISGGRSRRDVDTLLHTAAMARGNSGGPLVDECGRVIDAEFGFAISAREIIPFLRANSVQPQITTERCVPATQRALQSAAEQNREAFIEAERERQRLYEARELQLALAVALIVIGALLLAGGVVAMLYKNKWRRGALVGTVSIGVGIGLMAASVYVFVNRPSLALADASAATASDADAAEAPAEEADPEAGAEASE
jgi:S1-C subfamily serine protease